MSFSYYWRIRTMWRTKRVNGSALWQYDEAAPSTAYVQAGPVSNATTPTDLNMTVLLPNETFGWVSLDIVPHNKTIKPPTQAEVSRTIYLDGQQLVAGNGFRWSVSNFLYNPTTNLYNGSNAPTMPYLLGFYTEPESERKANYTAAKAYGGYDPGSNTWPAQIGEVLDLVIQNVAGPTSGLVESHPWHAHGQKYWDMGAGMGNFSYAALNASLAARTGIPFQRDTSIAYSGPGESYNNSMIGDKASGGWRLLRINVTDPCCSSPIFRLITDRTI